MQYGTNVESRRAKKRQLYEKLDEHRRNRNSEMTRIVEECHATKRATRDAVHSMVDQKRRKGIASLPRMYVYAP